MSTSNFCQLWLTVGSKAEADKIAKALLDKKLIACAKQISVSSDFRWQSKIENTQEILMQMDSRMDLFDRVEAEVAKLHSYDTFVLTAVPVAALSKSAATWLKDELK